MPAQCAEATSWWNGASHPIWESWWIKCLPRILLLCYGQCTTCISHKCSWGVRAISKANWLCKSFTLNSMWEFETNNLVLRLKKDISSNLVFLGYVIVPQFKWFKQSCKTLLLQVITEHLLILLRAFISVEQMNKKFSSNSNFTSFAK